MIIVLLKATVIDNLALLEGELLVQALARTQSTNWEETWIPERFVWQRSKENIYPAKEIILK